MKIFKTFSVFLVILSLFFFLNCGGSSDDDDDGDGTTPLTDPELPDTALPDATNPVKTIMVYLDADNNLEDAGVEDFNEMEAVDLSGTDLKIVVLMDRHAGYDSTDGNWSGTRLYEVAYDSPVVNLTTVSTRLSSTELGLSNSGDSDELNMGDPSTLSNFISYVKSNYEGNYALILWNHGGGWRDRINQIKKDISAPKAAVGEGFVDQPDQLEYPQRGVCWDETDGDDNLYMDEVQDAVKNKGITVIGFDACLMGMIEVAFEIRNNASYMIASEESEPGDGWEYNSWLASFISSPNMNAEDLCNAIVDAYEIRYSGTSYTTLSAINLSKVWAVFSTLNTFSTALYNSITDSTIQTNVWDTITDGTTQNYYGGAGSDFNVDLWHMADRIANAYDYCDTESSALKTAVDNCVIAEWHHSTGVGNSNGLAIHVTGTDSGGDIYYWVAYSNGYPDTYPVDFVQSSWNTWVVHYSGGSAAGPGLLYRLIFESL